MATITCPCGIKNKNSNEIYSSSTKTLDLSDVFIDGEEYDVWLCPHCGRIIVFEEKTLRCVAVYRPEKLFRKSLETKRVISVSK